jgi:hypothetical protein
MITLKQFVKLTTALFGDYGNIEEIDKALNNAEKKTTKEEKET